MKSLKNPFSKIASVVFGIIAILHLLRLSFFHVEIVVGNFHVPMWISILGFIATVILCVGLWKEADRRQ
jgi:hypothetical protein